MSVVSVVMVVRETIPGSLAVKTFDALRDRIWLWRMMIRFHASKCVTMANMIWALGWHGAATETVPAIPSWFPSNIQFD